MQLRVPSVVNRILMVVSFTSLFLTALALVLIRNNPATGYESSIYTSTPALVWAFLIGSIMGGTFILVHQAFARDRRSNIWIIGFLILILNNFIILSIHALRGYFMYANGDALRHIGMMKEIEKTGHFGSNNIYPIIHILSSTISEICGVTPNVVAKYLPAYLSTLFMVVFTYNLAKVSLREKGQILLASAACFIFPFNSLHLMIYPHTFSVFLFIPIFYLYFKSLKNAFWQFRIFLILLLILIPYSHPLGSIMMILLLTTIELTRITFKITRTILRENKQNSAQILIGKSFVNPIIISFVTFFMWISSFAWFGAKVSVLWRSIFEPFKNPHLVNTLETAKNLQLMQIIELNLKVYGDNLVYTILVIIAGIIVVKRVINKEVTMGFPFLLFIVFIMCIPFEYILFTGVGSTTVGRMLNLEYQMTIAPILVGFALYELFKNKRYVLAIGSVSLGLIVIFIISILFVYQSPWMFSPSFHITYRDMEGSNWFYEYRDSTLEFEAMGIVSPLIEGGTTGLIPEHFNYSQHGVLGKSLTQDSYVILNKRCRLANEDPTVAKARINMISGWGFNERDFDKLESDPTVIKLYSNGEFDTFYVYGMQNY